MKTSTLNPLANTFIPSNAKTPSEMVTLGKISTKSMATKLIKDLIESKKVNSEKSITKEEIMAIVEKLIFLRHKENPISDAAILKAYLTNKVPNIWNFKPLVGTKRDPKDPKSLKVATKIRPFDMSTFRAPKMSILLVSFWGLNRQEQALRPMLSFKVRPEALEDKVWSVTSKDLKVWNTCAIESPCDCPPMFGYTVPPDFFGNPFNFESKCSVKSIHLNHYPDTEHGNEMTLMDTERRIVSCSDIFSDMEEMCAEKDMEYYSEQFKTIVSGVCSMISEENKDSEEVPKIEESSDTDSAGDMTLEVMKSLWDSDPSTIKRPTGDEIIEDDDCHPLLDALLANAKEIPNNEGVTLEIQEMIRKGLSTDSEAKDPNSEEEIQHEDACEPPCSSWCHLSPKSTRRSSEAIDLLNETTQFLLNGEGCVSNKHRVSNAFEVGLNQSLRPNFKRSFSVNDGDDYTARQKMGSIAKFSTSTREALAFLRRDPINFFKSLNDRSDSWKDSDSGIVSHCSSQEDVYCDTEGNEEVLEDDTAPMWNLFSGEGSLWQPLPDALDESVKFPHKRVRELRRQRSLN